MRIKNIFSYLLLFATALFVQSCSDSDDASATKLNVLLDGATAVDKLTFQVPSSYKMICIDTDADWTVSVPEVDTTWLHITPHAGYGHEELERNTYVRVSVDTNNGIERSSTLTVKAGGMTQNVAIVQAGSGASADDPFESAHQLIQNLVLGYNLGNTLESNPSGQDWWESQGSHTPIQWETAWGQPETTQKIIDDIVARGFNIIRVPVTWGPHCDANDVIDEAWMNRVQEVVDMVLKADAYCILNVQHDTGASGWLIADIDEYPTLTVRYQKIWQQIANRFRDYDQKLIFESFNEILNKQYSWTAPAAGNQAYTAINKLQQDFVNVVRQTGGNNKYRNLALTTYAATSAQAAIDGFEAPADVVANHLYVSIHSYDPYNFCNNNSGKNADGSSYDYNINVFNDDCETEITNVVSRVAKRFNSLGLPYLFGEFGAIDEGKNMNERIKYATFITQKFKQYNTTGLWWMGLYNRKTGEWYEDGIVNALFEGIK